MKNIRKEDFKAWNEDMVKKYDPDAYHHHPNPVVRYIESKRVRKVIDLLNLNKEEVLLEAGCGAGNILEGLDCRKIIGVDLSLYMLGKARQKNIDHVHLLGADIESLPFRDQRFDKIICSEVLEHVMDPQRAISEIMRVLRDNGLLIISIPNEDLINFFKKILIKLTWFRLIFPKQNRAGCSYDIPDDMTDEWHLHMLNLRILRGMLGKNIKITAYKGIPFDFLPLRYVLRCQKG
ncbi:MAG: class I SAM-dependent methyltransferase [Nitrospirae bacterium]|nr:class I SAM-dependent methyltransferase [Nitrospirota bacterium]